MLCVSPTTTSSASNSNNNNNSNSNNNNSNDATVLSSFLFLVFGGCVKIVDDFIHFSVTAV